MKANEMVELIMKENPELLGDVPKKQATALIRQVFVQLSKKLDEHDEGVVKVQRFGNFRIRMIEKEKEGKKVSVKRIIFNPAKAASAKPVK